jgi:type IV pilus assembly protein PilN
VIRINLMERKRQQAREGGQTWLLLLLVAVVLEAVILFIFQAGLDSEHDAVARGNRELQEQLNTKQAAISDHSAIRAELETLRAREDAIAKLQNARTGPTAVLLEVARILTPGRGPSTNPEELNRLRRENPLAMYNVNWDPRRLWVVEIDELDRGKTGSRKLTDLGYQLKSGERVIQLKGVARDGEDVAELAKRLNLSGYFYDVALLPAVEFKSRAGGSNDYVDFALAAKVRY